MKIKCALICRITEIWKGGKVYEILPNDAGYYSNDDNFKIDYKLRISRINSKHELLETLKDGDWFIKSTKSETIRFISFADVKFAYLEKNDTIYIEQNFITV